LSILLTVLSQKVVKIEITLEIFDISRIIFAAGLLVMRLLLSHKAGKLLGPSWAVVAVSAGFIFAVLFVK